MENETVLDAILANKRRELLDPVSLPQRRRNHFSFRSALSKPGVRMILECKRRSPSAGSLRDHVSLEQVLDAYEGVADAISVLTDSRFFGGSLDDLASVANRANVPVLRKDFIIDPRQVHEAHAFGADAVLLMLCVLDDETWTECTSTASRLGMDVLTEVHDEAELERALFLDAPIIGINNRSFRDLSVDLDVTRRLAPRVPPGRIVVCESGIRRHDEIRSLAPKVDAFLVGSSLMGANDIGVAARELVHGETKICGITKPGDALKAWHAGARWGGLVFARHSPRSVNEAQAQAISAASPLPLVGVFVDEKPKRIGELARKLSLAAVQLHGNENRQRIEATRAELPKGCGLWKAIAVHGNHLPELPDNVDRIVLDARQPGSGKAFDWSLLREADSISRIALAGGISCKNVSAALATGAAMLDVSSGVEASTGTKCEEKLHALFDSIRRALQQPEEVHEETE